MPELRISRQVRCLSTSAPRTADSKESKKRINKSPQALRTWLWDQLLHMWHGFRLLAINSRTAVQLKNKVFSGQKLTRREQHLLETTTRDLLRLLPLSVFVIVPGAELLLPVALVIFPDMMPSTFITSEQRRIRMITRNLDDGVMRRRLFEHMVARILVVDNLGEEAGRLQTFRSVLRGGVVAADDIRSLAHIFHEDGPLAFDRLPRYILRDLCQTMAIYGKVARLESILLPKAWNAVRLRFILSKELEHRERDDTLLAKLDLDTLTQRELERESERRRLRWFGPPEALKQQLKDWLLLSLDPDVPNHLLLFLRPCASEGDILLSHLSQEERDHILGLDKYNETPTYNNLRFHTDQAAKAAKAAKKAQEAKAKEKEAAKVRQSASDKESVSAVEEDGTRKEEASRIEGLEKPLMEEDLDSLKHHIEEVQEEELACKQEMAQMEQALRTWTDEELLALFDSVATSDGDAQEVSIEKALHERLCSDGWTSEQVHDMLARFDFDNSGHICREEFKGFLSRCRDAGA